MRVLHIALLIGVAGLPGCVVVQTGVTNPIPGMTTVAVAPFVNLSAERAVDGRRFALAYHAELQKVPGYQVIPVGVTERAMIDLGLDLDGPDDALKLAQALGADAVVIGAITDYTPYYPPRIGLQVSWYSPEPWRFVPGIPTDPQLGDTVRGWRFAGQGDAPPAREIAASGPAPLVLRAQSPEEVAGTGAVVHANGVRGDNPILLTGIETDETGAVVQANAVQGENPIHLAGIETGDTGDGPILFPPFPNRDESPAVQTVAAEEVVAADQNVAAEQEATPQPPAPLLPSRPLATGPTAPSNLDSLVPFTSTESAPAIVPPEFPTPVIPSPADCPPPALPGEVDPPTFGSFATGSSDPRQPVMSYTRLFDGSDAELTALLRDYVILSGDLRSGGWEAYLHRTEDFMRFTAHRMIVEMLTLHGGESKRRYVWMLRRDSH